MSERYLLGNEFFDAKNLVIQNHFVRCASFYLTRSIGLHPRVAIAFLMCKLVITNFVPVHVTNHPIARLQCVFSCASASPERFQ